MSDSPHWFCQKCGTFDGPISSSFCDVCADGWKVEGLVPVAVAADWLRHVDRLDDIPGAGVGLPQHNPLWDASGALERKFGGSRALLAKATSRPSPGVGGALRPAVDALRDAWGYLAHDEPDAARVVIERACEVLGVDPAIHPKRQS